MTSAADRPRFHLAVPVDNLQAARRFYSDVLRCRTGRESDRWIDFDFYGHQLTAHLIDEPLAQEFSNNVDGKNVPVRHFGLILDWQIWHELRDSLLAANIDFLIEPGIRFKGHTGEQATLFIQDPAGNGIEFKAFRDSSLIFERQVTL